MYYRSSGLFTIYLIVLSELWIIYKEICAIGPLNYLPYICNIGPVDYLQYIMYY